MRFLNRAFASFCGPIVLAVFDGSFFFSGKCGAGFTSLAELYDRSPGLFLRLCLSISDPDTSVSV